MLTSEDVIKTAKLAKLKLTEEEIAKFTSQLSAILSYIDKLAELNTDEIVPMLHTNFAAKNRMRVDVSAKSLSIDEVLKNAARKDGRYIVTNNVL